MKRKKDFKHNQIKNTIKYHLARCYYELFLEDPSFFETLIAQLETIEKYFRRINLPEDRLRRSLNFLSFLKKLATMRLTGKLNEVQRQNMEKNYF